MTDDPVSSTSGRSDPARFNGGSTSGSLAVGRKLQPKRFVRQQVCAAILSMETLSLSGDLRQSGAADSGRCLIERRLK